MPPIEHLVVLMMENRSFDHMLGFAKSNAWPIDGLTGTETCDSPSGGPDVPVTKDARYSGDYNADPGHAFLHVNTQIFGNSSGTPNGPLMRGFVKDYALISNSNAEAPNVMKCFTAPCLPVLTTLAQQYAVCDRWFSSVPGPTIPNRMFGHGASSVGSVDQDALASPFMLKTIFEVLDKSSTGASYGIYVSDNSILSFNSYLVHNQDAFRNYSDFDTDCKNGDLPSYCFIEPRYSDSTSQQALANSQHPDYGVDQGEAMIADVYRSLTQNPDVWNSSLLLIVYDEHGGLYDHVPPPVLVPDPSAPVKPSTDPVFDFSRLGVRVPAVLASPLIDPNTVVPQQFDHCSIVSTVRKLFCDATQQTPFNWREAAAATFDTVLNRTTPRTDIVNFPAPQPEIEEHISLAASADSVYARALSPNDPPLTRKPSDLVMAMVRNAEYALNALGLPSVGTPSTVYSAEDANEYLARANALLRERGNHASN
jgi:phospholipase C